METAELCNRIMQKYARDGICLVGIDGLDGAGIPLRLLHIDIVIS